MKRIILSLFLIFGILASGLFLYQRSTKEVAATEWEEESELPYIQATTECGQVTLDFYNPTDYFFSFDYQVDDEEGHEDQYSNLNIQNGPWAGYSFGLRYNEVDVSAGGHEQRVIDFDEDSGLHTVSFRLWRGAENDWYLDWDIREVDSNCKPDLTPTPTPTPEEPRTTTPAGAPQCTDSTPLVLPSNVHVIRDGSDATVNFFTQSSNANVYYKEVSSPNWQHALRDIPVTGGYVSVTVHDLVPSLGYTFGVQAANSCAGGETVLAVVVDGPAPVTFGFSFWEWLK